MFNLNHDKSKNSERKSLFFSGRPPYPIVKDLSSGELEYITTWLDHYHVGPDPKNPRPIVGYLKEFKDQQEEGTTTFKLPDIPQ